MAKKVLFGNWKMNQNLMSSESWIKTFNQYKINYDNILYGIAAPYLYLHTLNNLSQNHFMLGAQNCASFTEGAYTGEISATMLKDLNTAFCIVGHSERRILFNETSERIISKVKQLQKHNIIPVLCVGEHLEDREKNRYKDVIEQQLTSVLNVINLDTPIIIAYEPVWAIGTGKTATKEEAQEVHLFIRVLLESLKIGLGESTSIIYGGSCNPSNAKSLFNQPDIDGGLIGGASLNPKDFKQLLLSF